jgi:peroxiredoxin (alkyl hydroperoxide reductase subunit C)
MKKYLCVIVLLAAVLFSMSGLGFGESDTVENYIYKTEWAIPIDSVLKVKAGQPAPDFTLPAVSGKQITLSQYKGKKNVLISFVPAAFTFVCSNQLPGYNLIKDIFDENEAVLLSITVDNIPTLHAWTRQMGGIWFDVLSDFWPHGAVADKYGVLRSDGVAERALFVVDKEGIIRATLVADINRMPDLKVCANELKKLNKK